MSCCSFNVVCIFIDSLFWKKLTLRIKMHSLRWNCGFCYIFKICMSLIQYSKRQPPLTYLKSKVWLSNCYIVRISHLILIWFVEDFMVIKGLHFRFTCLQSFLPLMLVFIKWDMVLEKVACATKPGWTASTPSFGLIVLYHCPEIVYLSNLCIYIKQSNLVTSKTSGPEFLLRIISH